MSDLTCLGHRTVDVCAAWIVWRSLVGGEKDLDRGLQPTVAGWGLGLALKLLGLRTAVR